MFVVQNPRLFGVEKSQGEHFCFVLSVFVSVCFFVSIYGMASKVISMDFSDLDHRSSTENEDRSEKKSGAVVSSKVFSRFIFSFQSRFRKSQFLSRSSKASFNLLRIVF